MFAAARPRTIARPSVRAAASARRASRAAARVHARANDGDVNVDRREFVRNAAFAALSATLVAPREARAGFFGGDKEEKYQTETKAIIEQVKQTLEMAPGTEGREESINTTRNMTNAWVAKYRRDNKTTGKPSYGQVYSALNAVSGHFNNFGTKYPFPAKRKDRVFAEFEQAELLLSRGR